MIKTVTWKQVINYQWQTRDCSVHFERQGRRRFQSLPIYQVPERLGQWGLIGACTLTFSIGDRHYQIDMNSARYERQPLRSGRMSVHRLVIP